MTTGRADKTFSTAALGRVGDQLRLGYAMGSGQVLTAGYHPTAAERDRELVAFVARLGVVQIAHVMAAMGCGRTAAYRRVAVLAEAGLVERLALLRGEPSLIRATRAGLRHVGLDALGIAVVRPGGADHWLRCADVALRLEEEFGAGGRVLAERELMLAERVEGRPLAGAPITQHGREGLHRPDLAVLAGSRTIAVEVELSIKAPRRLDAIMRAWRRASHVGEVRYLCGSPGVRRAVERAVAATYAEGKVRVGELRR